MNSVEGSFGKDPIDINLLPTAQAKMEKLKLGEIFQLWDQSITINCVHCSQEFHYFNEFTLHIEEHFLNGKIQGSTTINDFDLNSTIEILTKEEPPFNFSPEWIEANDENNSFDNNLEKIDNGRDNNMITRKTFSKNKESTLPPEIKTVELNSFQQFATINEVKIEENVRDVHEVKCFSVEAATSTPTKETEASNRKLGNMRQAHVPKDFSCSLCSMHFSRLYFVNRHLQSVHGCNNISSIETAASAVSQSEPIKEDKTLKTDTKKAVECLVCNGLYSSKFSLKHHMRIVHEPKRFSCSLCLERFAWPKNLRKHIEMVHNVIEPASINKMMICKKKKISHDRKEYDCLVCFRKYSTRSFLCQHMKLVHEPQQKRFECFICHRSQLPNTISIRRHMRDEHKINSEKKFKCSVCKVLCFSKDKLHRHMRAVHGPKQFSCSLCLENFASSRHLFEHIKIVHGIIELDSLNKIVIHRTKKTPKSRRNFTCFICYQDYSTRCLLNEHMLLHEPNRKGIECFECLVCHRQFSTLVSLECHMQYVHGPKQFFCPVCLSRYTRPENAKQHIQKMHGITEYFPFKAISLVHKHLEIAKHVFAKYLKRKFECFDCHRQFATIKLTRYHLNHAHGAKSLAKPFSCPFCFARSTRMTNLQKHIKAAHGQRIKHKAILATQPKTEEINQKLLEIKIESKRQLLERNRKHICDICGLEFQQSGGLQRHMENSHGNGKKSKCEICNKMISKDYYREHIEIHTGEKKEQCTVCGKQFLNKKRLRGHMLGHVEKALHKCSICDKAFKRYHSLVIHRRLHPEEMPHTCKTCNVGFLNIDSLKKHQYKHEKVKT